MTPVGMCDKVQPSGWDDAHAKKVCGGAANIPLISI